MKHEEVPNRLGLGIAISLIAYLFFVMASTTVWNFQGRFPTIQIIFIQNCVSLICILPLSLRKGFHHLKTEELPTHLVRDFCGVLSYYLYFVAIRFLNLVDATTLNYTAPFFVPFIWWIWKKEKINPHAWWSIIVGFIGVAVILNPSREIFQIGFLFGVCAGLASSIAFAALRVLNTKKEPMSRTLFYYFFVGSIISFPFAWVYWVHPSGWQWLEVTGIGVATAIGQILLTISYRYGTASYLSPLGYATVIYAGIISWLLFDKPLGLRSVIGASLIVIGGVLTFVLRKKTETLVDTLKVSKDQEKPPL